MYSQSGHEIWKQWVALVNDKDPTDDGVQGYLKFSVSIVGPDDRPVVHADNEDSNAATATRTHYWNSGTPRILLKSDWNWFTVRISQRTPPPYILYMNCTTDPPPLEKCPPTTESRVVVALIDAFRGHVECRGRIRRTQ